MKTMFKLLIKCAVLFLVITSSCFAQCPSTIQDQGNNNAISVTLTFYASNGTVLGTCNCSVAGQSGNLNCPASCPYDVPGTGYLTIGYSDQNGNNCLYDANGSLISTLPIELLDFNVSLVNDKVKINWETATETNNDFFTIERTSDFITFENISTIPAAGNSTTKRAYTAEDNNPKSGIVYYHLKQTDYNGKYSYSGYKGIEFKPQLNFSFSVYPNPGTVENINYSVNADKDKEVLIVVYDVTGRETYSKVILTEQQGTNVFALDPSGKLTPGIYLITASTQDSVTSKKLIIQ